ncbi:mating pair formation protein TrbE [Photobacterium profundum]|uniref:Hypothetical TrbE protein n=1 Tax=Photobacterium profundum (strain SS9) TaxID=298386 RepID=Q6LGX0_PHOPR|nr:mating pair formation protein TrbE [Photobacterium profundum]CAG23460.1 hypothetical TrbE protein [Photobacterium profundum SS9]
MFNLKSYRDTQQGTPDLLNWAAMVDNGVMLNKDGSFTAAWTYTGLDAATATNTDRNDAVYRVNRALSSLGSGWMIHVDAIRQQTGAYPPPESSHFPHPALQLIDDSRRIFFEGQGDKYTSTTVIAVTYMPPVKTLSKITDLIFEHQDKKESIATKNLARFNEKLNDIEGRLSASLRLTRLEAHQEDGRWVDPFLSYLRYCLTGHWHLITVPIVPMAIDSLIGAVDMWTGFEPKVDDAYVSLISIDGFPLLSSPNVLNALDYMNVEYRWSTRFVFFDNREAIQLLKTERKKWEQKVVSFKDKLIKNPNPPIDADALNMVNQYESANTALSAGELQYGHYTSTFVLRHKDRHALAEMTEYTTKTLNLIAGFSCRVETVNATEALLGTLPSDSLHNIRRPLLSTDNLCDLLPLASIWTGSETCPCPFYPDNSPPLMVCTAQGNTPFRLNLHVEDVGHTLLFGPTGKGKSTALAIMVAQCFRYPNAQVFVFDKKRSMYALSQLGGTHIDIGDNSAPSFAPLCDLDNDFEWCCDYIEQLLVLQSVSVTPAMRSAIFAALTTMRGSPIQTLSEFKAQCQHNEIKTAIEYYTVQGRSGDLLDAQEDTLSLASFMVFEIDGLMKRGDKDAIPVLSYLFRRIERSLNGQPSFIVLDEAWVAFSHPIFLAMLKEWLKELRKANCAVILATQSLSDAIKSGILDVLVESCPTQIFLPNEKAPLFAETYHQFGLNDKQIELLRHATPKRDYYVCQPTGNRLIDLSLDPIALAFVAAGSKDDIQRVKALVHEHQESWYIAWLTEQGLSFAP